MGWEQRKLARLGWFAGCDSRAINPFRSYRLGMIWATIMPRTITTKA